ATSTKATATATAAMRADTKLFTSFLCTKCNTRNAKLISKQAYHHGVVLCRCTGCQALHLFADHLKWFSDESVRIEDICKHRGIGFATSDTVDDLTAEQRNTLRQPHSMT